jgi:hypothetical protein
MIPSQSTVFTNLVGTVRNNSVLSDTGSMLPNPNALVETLRGVRIVLPEEWGKLQCMPKHWAAPPSRCLGRLLSHPGLHVLSTIGEIVHRCFDQAAEVDFPFPPLKPLRDLVNGDTSPCEYELPVISENSVFRVERLEALYQASSHYPHPADIVTEVHDILANHRYNYGPDGPHSRVVIWWE